MDAGMAIKPVVSAPSGHAQPTFAFTAATQTELPRSKVVPPLVKVVPPLVKADPPLVNDDPTRPEQKPQDTKPTTRDAIIDPETNEVVYRVLDERTRRVVHQAPDQALLRMQAYDRAKAIRALLKDHRSDCDCESGNTGLDKVT
jgi:hypothetical protein